MTMEQLFQTFDDTGKVNLITAFVRSNNIDEAKKYLFQLPSEISNTNLVDEIIENIAFKAIGNDEWRELLKTFLSIRENISSPAISDIEVHAVDLGPVLIAALAAGDKKTALILASAPCPLKKSISEYGKKHYCCTSENISFDVSELCNENHIKTEHVFPLTALFAFNDEELISAFSKRDDWNLMISPLGGSAYANKTTGQTSLLASPRVWSKSGKACASFLQSIDFSSERFAKSYGLKSLHERTSICALFFNEKEWVNARKRKVLEKDFGSATGFLEMFSMASENSIPFLINRLNTLIKECPNFKNWFFNKSFQGSSSVAEMCMSCQIRDLSHNVFDLYLEVDGAQFTDQIKNQAQYTVSADVLKKMCALTSDKDSHISLTKCFIFSSKSLYSTSSDLPLFCECLRAAPIKLFQSILNDPRLPFKEQLLNYLNSEGWVHLNGLKKKGDLLSALIADGSSEKALFLQRSFPNLNIKRSKEMLKYLLDKNENDKANTALTIFEAGQLAKVSSIENNVSKVRRRL